MRDVVAALVAAALIFVALSLLTTLHVYRKRHRTLREQEIAQGRAIVVELPTDPELTLFTEDAEHFYYGRLAIDKRDIIAVRVLINGAPIAAFARSGQADVAAVRGEEAAELVLDDRAEGILRDRWDVAIETASGTHLIECGAIRERVSQELARKIFDAVSATIRAQAGPPDD